MGFILREKIESTKKKWKEESRMPQINIYRKKHLESDCLKNDAYFLHFSYYSVNIKRKFNSSSWSEVDNLKLFSVKFKFVGSIYNKADRFYVQGISIIYYVEC